MLYSNSKKTFFTYIALEKWAMLNVMTGFMCHPEWSEVKELIAQVCPTLCEPMDCSPPAPLSMEFSRQ